MWPSGQMITLIKLLVLFSLPIKWWNDRNRKTNPEPQTPNKAGVSQMSMKRAVGYCENTDCEDYAKGVFLLNHGDPFYCPRCRDRGFIEHERGHHVGDTPIFKEVRVEFNFDPLNRKFREIAVVRDESLWGRCSVYTLHSPLIKTERRALKVAESLLANLNRFGLKSGEGLPRSTETILSFDDNPEEFTRKCNALYKSLKESQLSMERRMDA